jgi:hypothetical protein
LSDLIINQVVVTKRKIYIARLAPNTNKHKEMIYMQTQTKQTDTKVPLMKHAAIKLHGVDQHSKEWIKPAKVVKGTITADIHAELLQKLEGIVTDACNEADNNGLRGVYCICPDLLTRKGKTSVDYQINYYN